MMQDELREALTDFVYLENRLLDERRYEQWYELFADDGVYWVPTDEDQTDKELHASIALEDKMLLKLRIDRMRHAQAHSLHPKVRALRVVQRPEMLPPTPDGLQVAGCNLIYMERQGGSQVTLGASVRYTLRSAGQVLRIVEKRVALLGCDGFFPAIQLFV